MEPVLRELTNDDLKKEVEYFKKISTDSKDPLRTDFVSELKRCFEACDLDRNGAIDRREFENLIHGFFTLKNLKSSRENYDNFFSRIDENEDRLISFDEFVEFSDMVNAKEVVESLTKEMKRRGLA
jgi:hypothetical protein